MRLICLPPIVYFNPHILILGTFPGVKSLEKEEYYGHTSNGFWKVLSGALDEPVPQNYEAKKLILKKHRLALWDIFGSCRRQGSNDSEIRDFCINPIPEFLKKYPSVKKVLVESRTAEKIWIKHIQDKTPVPGVYIPSPSSLARMPLLKKIQYWKKELQE